jgi:hypothetical protein
MKIVHLIVTYENYDDIVNGIKKVEYRNNTEYWRKRFFGHDLHIVVVFHRGYSDITVGFKVKQIVVDFSVSQIQIHLGNRACTECGKEIEYYQFLCTECRVKDLRKRGYKI